MLRNLNTFVKGNGVPEHTDRFVVHRSLPQKPSGSSRAQAAQITSSVTNPPDTQSTLDLMSGYWQIPVASDDFAKTAFTTSLGLLQFTTMPFGLCNAPSSFQRAMDSVLTGLKWKTCIVYLNERPRKRAQRARHRSASLVESN